MATGDYELVIEDSHGDRKIVGTRFGDIPKVKELVEVEIEGKDRELEVIEVSSVTKKDGARIARVTLSEEGWDSPMPMIVG